MMTLILEMIVALFKTHSLVIFAIGVLGVEEIFGQDNDSQRSHFKLYSLASFGGALRSFSVW